MIDHKDKENLFVLMKKNSKKINFFSINTLNSFDFIPYNKNLIVYTTQSENIDSNKKWIAEKIIKKERILQQNLKKLTAILSLNHSFDGLSSICDIIDNHASKNFVIYKACQFYKAKHYLHFRGLIDLSPNVNGDSITLIGGPCLFGVKDVFLQTNQDQYSYPLSIKERELTDFNIIALHLKNRYSLYEYESIIRQTNVVSTIINALKNKVVITLRVDVPNVHYYFYFLNYFLHKKNQ